MASPHAAPVTFRKRILLVDDDPIITEAIRVALEATGRYEIQEQHNPRMALHTARRFQPDLILLDVVMPDVDGGELARRFQCDEGLRQIPIVFLTGLVSEQEVACGGGVLGGFSFLAKPLRLKEIVACVGEMLAMRPFALSA